MPGATGFLDTNYEGKGQAAAKAIDDYDLVFVHVEAPDEAGHEGNAEAKKQAIEQVDKHVVGPVLEALQRQESWRILLLPDHPTPVKSGAHSAAPVPFAMAGTGITGILHAGFGETNAAQSGLAHRERMRADGVFPQELKRLTTGAAAGTFDSF